MYSSDRLSIGMQVFDVFDSSIVGERCDIYANVLNISTPELLQFGPLADSTLLSFYFVFPFMETAPSVFNVINFTVQYRILQAKTQTFASVNLCRIGQIATKDAALFWACIDCSAGTDVDQQNGTTCLQCSGGTFSSVRVTGCSTCLAGTWSLPGSPGCSQCTAGRFSNRNGSVSCTDCSVGSYSPIYAMTYCQACPPTGTTESSGSNSIRQCICLQGNYGAPYYGIPCKTCPHWRVPGTEAHVLDCIPSSAPPLK